MPETENIFGSHELYVELTQEIDNHQQNRIVGHIYSDMIIRKFVVTCPSCNKAYLIPNSFSLVNTKRYSYCCHCKAGPFQYNIEIQACKANPKPPNSLWSDLGESYPELDIPGGKE